MIAAIFLVAGTCIGGGMLALPVTTGESGFFPSATMMLLCWLAMTSSALLLLEANLWMKEGAHVITMASVMLGPAGKAISWVIYLFISYASIVAYSAAGGSLVLHGASNFFGWEISKEWACLLFILSLSGVIYSGSHIVGRANTVLFIAMIVAYFFLVSMGASEVKMCLLRHTHWSSSLLAIPLLLTTFSFQTMLPSLTSYLKKNVAALRWSIIAGTTLTLFVYLMWQFLVLGIVPVSGAQGLVMALEVGEPVTQFLREHVQSSCVAVVAEYFAFFALVTSFLGIALGLFDFLSDGLKIRKEGGGKILLSVLVIVPTFIFSAYFERVFLVALEVTGGFGDSILNGIMPVIMVWRGRYAFKFPNEYRLPGGKWMLAAVLTFFCFALVLETLVQMGWTHFSYLAFLPEFGAAFLDF